MHLWIITRVTTLVNMVLHNARTHIRMQVKHARTHAHTSARTHTRRHARTHTSSDHLKQIPNKKLVTPYEEPRCKLNL